MKKVVLVLLGLIILCGCQKKQEKFYLNENYYNVSGLKEITKDDILENDNFILFTYNNYCSLAIPCEDIFKEFSENNNIQILSIPFDEFKNTKYYEKVKYGPSVLIIKDGNLVAYLNAEKNSDMKKYQDVNEFTEWIKNYIYLTPQKES